MCSRCPVPVSLGTVRVLASLDGSSLSARYRIPGWVCCAASHGTRGGCTTMRDLRPRCCASLLQEDVLYSFKLALTGRGAAFLRVPGDHGQHETNRDRSRAGSGITFMDQDCSLWAREPPMRREITHLLVVAPSGVRSGGRGSREPARSQRSPQP